MTNSGSPKLTVRETYREDSSRRRSGAANPLGEASTARHPHPDREPVPGSRNLTSRNVATVGCGQTQTASPISTLSVQGWTV